MTQHARLPSRPVRAFMCALLLMDNRLGLDAAGYEFEGIGASQVSRGGATVAHVADWTAVYWNPAGLARGGSGRPGEIGLQLFGGRAKSDDGNSLSGLVGPIFAKNHLESSFLLGSAGAVIPAAAGWTFGAGAYTPLLQGAQFTDESPAAKLEYNASAGILVINVSAAHAAGRLLIGAGINAVNARLRSESTLTTPSFSNWGKQSGSGWGLEAVLGAQWEASPRWKLGAVIRSGARIPVRGRAEATSTVLPSENTPFTYIFRHPPTAAAGVSFVPAPRWLSSFDVNFTGWSRFESALDYESSGALLADSDNAFDWKDTFKFRFGTSFRFRTRTELSGGISYDQYAVDDGSVDFSTTIDTAMFRTSAGLSQEIGKSLKISGGILTAKGLRKDTGRNIGYSLGGWQGTIEASWAFRP